MKKNSRGFSIVETLIAAALVVVLATAVAYFITGQKQASFKVSHSSECVNLATSLLAEIDGLGTTTNILQPFVATTGGPDAYGVGLGPQNRIVGQWFSREWGAPIIEEKVNPAVNNASLIMGSVSAAQAIYNSNPNRFCGQVNGESILDRIYPGGAGKPPFVQNIFLKIEPTTGGCPARAWSVPIGAPAPTG